LVPTRAGRLRIPEIRIPWWDTNAEQLRYAVLPAREIAIGPGETRADTPAVASVPSELQGQTPAESYGESVKTTSDGKLWQIIAGISAVGWLVTGAWLIMLKRKPTAVAAEEREHPSETAAYKALLAACAGDNAAMARKSLVDWCHAIHPEHAVYSLDQVLALLSDPALDTAVTELNHHLYGEAGAVWQGAKLADVIRDLRQRRRKPARTREQPLALYPDATG
jgi:hypothetical protein